VGLAAGDTLRFYDYPNNNPIATGTVTVASVTTTTQPPGIFSQRAGYTGSTWSGHTFYQVTLTTVPSPSPVLDDFVCSPERCGKGYSINNCVTLNNASRGAYVEGDNGTINNSIFDGNFNCGILLGPYIESNGRAGADYTHNVTIANNVIENGGIIVNGTPAFDVVGITPSTNAASAQPASANITFENNVVSDWQGGNNFAAYQVNGMTVANNAFQSPQTYNHQQSGLILLENTAGVNFSTNNVNTVIGPGPNMNQTNAASYFNLQYTNTGLIGDPNGVTIQQ
jgi:hypothetical protein